MKNIKKTKHLLLFLLILSIANVLITKHNFIVLYLCVYLKIHLYFKCQSKKNVFFFRRSSDFLFKMTFSRGKGIHLYMMCQNDLKCFPHFPINPSLCQWRFWCNFLSPPSKMTIIISNCLSLFRLFYQIPQVGWLITSRNVVLSYGGWEVQHQGAGRLAVWWGPSSCFIGIPLLSVSSHMVEGENFGLFSSL